MKKSVCGILFLLLCITGSAMAAKAPVTVFVNILPQEYVVNKIAGNTVKVITMIPKGASPATYEPKPSQMKELAGAKAYFSIGVPFEKIWIDKVKASNKSVQFFSADKGIQKLPMENHSCEADGHGANATTHVNTGMMTDPHIWLSPKLMKKIAQNTYEGLVRISPQEKEVYRKNLNSFLKEIDALDGKIRQTVAKMPKDSAFMVFHPAWGYFAHDYGLEQIAIEVDGKEPKPAQLKEVIQTAKKHHVTVIFIQPQFSQKTAQLVAKAIDGKVLSADPLAKDWANNLLAQTIQFQKAIQK